MKLGDLSRGRPLEILILLSLAMFALGMTVFPLLFWPAMVMITVASLLFWRRVVGLITGRRQSRDQPGAD